MALWDTASKNCVHISKNRFTIKKCPMSGLLSTTVLLTGNVNMYPCLVNVCPSTLVLSLAERNVPGRVQAGLVSTSLQVKTNHLLWITHVFPQTSQSWILLTNLFLLHIKALWVWVSPCFFSVLQTQSDGDSWRRFSPAEMQPFVSHSSGRGPLWCHASTVRETAASSTIDSPRSTWACCHGLYISLYLIHC